MSQFAAAAIHDRAFRNTVGDAAGRELPGELESGYVSKDRRAPVLPVLGRQRVLPKERRDTGTPVGRAFGSESVSPLFRRAPSAACRAARKICAEQHCK